MGCREPRGEAQLVISGTFGAIRTSRLVAGAFAAAAVAAPIYAATITPAASPQVTAGPACLAWFGNKDDGKCLSYSNGNGVNVGTPAFNYCNQPAAVSSGCGVSTGPLLPGSTISQGVGGGG